MGGGDLGREMGRRGRGRPRKGDGEGRCGRERGSSPERDVWDMGGEKCSLTSSTQVLFSTFMHHIHTYIQWPQCATVSKCLQIPKGVVTQDYRNATVSEFHEVWSHKTMGRGARLHLDKGLA